MSFYDLRRFIPKCHILLDKSKDVRQQIAERAMGYSVTDPNTPFIREWILWVSKGYNFDLSKDSFAVESYLARWCLNESPVTTWPTGELGDPEMLRIACELCPDLGHLLEGFPTNRSVYHTPKFEIPCVYQGSIHGADNSPILKHILPPRVKKTPTTSSARPKNQNGTTKSAIHRNPAPGPPPTKPAAAPKQEGPAKGKPHRRDAKANRAGSQRDGQRS
jgi:hypothetical protein